MINLIEYGVPETILNNPSHPIARVTAVHRERYQIICSHGEAYAVLKSGVYFKEPGELFPTAGDYVEIQYQEHGDSLITKTFERKSCFLRKDPDIGRGEQAIAANFDTVFILTSQNRDFNPKRLERYVTAAWQSGGIPVIVLTKADLNENADSNIQEAQAAAPGVEVYSVSAKSGLGVSALEKYLRPGSTSVFLGSSGVGKSSLINVLAGENVMETGGIREDDSRGRHTTTHRQLLKLPCGALIIDTPGMREIGMWDVRTGLGEAFSDVEKFLGQCKFSDCTHTTEPGCAVRTAITKGELDESRWNSFLKLKKEARYSEDKGQFMRERQQKHKSISKSLKQKNKVTY